MFCYRKRLFRRFSHSKMYVFFFFAVTWHATHPLKTDKHHILPYKKLGNIIKQSLGLCPISIIPQYLPSLPPCSR